MAFRYHRSVKLLPGLRMNFSKSGVGFSAGFAGYHVSRSPNGRTRRTISIPGTGMSWISSSTNPGSSRGVDRHATVTEHAPPTPPPPPQMTPAETALADAIAADDLDRIIALGNGPTRIAFAAKVVSAWRLLQAHRDDEALSALEAVFATAREPLDDPFIRKYLDVSGSIEVTDGATAQVPLDRTAVGLFLGELYQRRGDLDRAIAVVHSLPRTTLTALSLADLLDAAGRFDDVIAVTEDAPNSDDPSSMLWVLRGVAFGQNNVFAAAYPCFAKVIRCTSRNPVVVHRARFERARCYQAEGKVAKARDDLGRVMAEDANFPGAAAALASLDAATVSGSG